MSLAGESLLAKFALLITSLCCLSFPALSQTAPPPQAGARVSYIKVGHLFDSRAGSYRDNVVLVLEGERIAHVGARDLTIPSGARVIDLSQAYVLPGLIDCHTHLGARA